LINFATRPSKLARWQTNWVIQALQREFPGLVCQVDVIATEGDRNIDRPLPEIGGKGLFTQELETQLISGHVHAAVHSLKDLPITDTTGLMIAAVPQRGEIRDVLLSTRGYTLESLPSAAQVGTSSLRRAAQLLGRRPDLNIRPLRGNVDTRIQKLEQGLYDAIVLSGAGVNRLGFEDYVSEWLPGETMLPAPGQGALAVQCRTHDEETRLYLRSIEDCNARLTTSTERAFLKALGGGCSLPVAALARLLEGKGEIDLEGLVISKDGKKEIRVRGTGTDPDEIGKEAALNALSQGAGEILLG
jgi:hydroxymethylbilane synthase